MSLEQALADNTAALKALTAALSTQVHAASAIPSHELAAPIPQPPAPPVQPAPPALSTAVVPPPPTAPVVPTATSPEPTSVFGQAAPISAAPVTPVAPPTASPAVTGNAELDVNGLPWDGRIHASSKAKVADGSWRMKRGVDEALVATVTAELKAALGAPAAAAPQVTAASMPWPFATSAADVAPLPVTAVPPPPPASAYAALMSRLTHHINVGDIKPQQVTDACVSLGVPNVAALAAREDLVPSVALALGVSL